MNEKLTYIDLFAGCGGLSLGLSNAGWKGLFAIEKDKYAFETLKFNLIDKNKFFKWPKWLPVENLDIDQVISDYQDNLSELADKVTLVAGGPPCQGFSVAGKRNKNDKRNDLVNSYINFIKIVRPKIIFFENVKGFTLEFKEDELNGKKYSDHVIKSLENNYYISSHIIDFSNYGVPQKRSRFILVGIRRDICKDSGKKIKNFFKRLEENKYKFLDKKGISPNTNLEDAISDLFQSNPKIISTENKKFNMGSYSQPKSKYQILMRKSYKGNFPDSHRFANHSDLIIERFKFALDNSSLTKKEFRDQFSLKKQSIKILKAKECTSTLTTLPDDYIHYYEPRILTVREYARIQSFPDDFEFKGKYTTGGHLRTKEVPRYSQIGNAIPPLFSEQSGLILKEMMLDE